MRQSYSTYLNSIGKKIYTLPRCGLSQYRLPGTFYVPLGFGVVLFAKVCFSYQRSFAKLWFYTGFIVPKL